MSLADFPQAISEAEKRAKVLKEDQKTVREAVNDNAKQTKMWADLERLFECKKKCLEQVRLLFLLQRHTHAIFFS